MPLALDRGRALAGHNMLELVIASVIFSTVVILFLGVWTTFYSSQSLARNRLAAASLGRSVMEQQIAAGFYACDPAVFSDSGPASFIYSDSEIRGRSTRCVLAYQFYAYDQTARPNFRKLTVRVNWTDHTGSKSLSYDTHLYRTN